MVAANNADFLGEGVLSPFGQDPTLDEQSRLEAARRERLRQAATATANINNAPGGYASDRGAADRLAIEGSNDAVTAERIARTGSARGNRHSFGGNLIRDPLTMGILAAPLGVLGAGAAIGGAGALGFGLGEGSLVGGGVGAGGAGTGLGAGGEAAALAGSQAGGAPAALAAQNAANGVIVGGGSGAAGAGTAGAVGSALAGGAAGAAGTAGSSLAPWLAPVAGSVASGALMYGLDRATSGRTKEEKQLVAKQEQMADEAARRREQVQQQSMDALGQQLMAFAPLNQAMASMYGPEAAFSQEQFANMAQNPMHPDVDPALINYQGSDPEMLARSADAARRIQQYDQAEEARRSQIMNNMPAPGPGPAPINMPAPQAARRY